MQSTSTAPLTHAQNTEVFFSPWESSFPVLSWSQREHLVFDPALVIKLRKKKWELANDTICLKLSSKLRAKMLFSINRIQNLWQDARELVSLAWSSLYVANFFQTAFSFITPQRLPWEHIASVHQQDWWTWTLFLQSKKNIDNGFSLNEVFADCSGGFKLCRHLSVFSG